MKKLIELSIQGNLYFFEYTINDNEFKILYEFSITYFKEKTLKRESFSLEQYISEIYNTLGFTLIPLRIDKIIAI